MSHPPLPVPDLQATVDRLLGAARPLLDEDAMAAARRDARAFLDGDGPRLQDRLLRLAEQEEAEGRSWLTRPWLEGYLRVREPLPLSTNVGFQLADEPGAPGVERAARFIHRAAAVHLRHLRGQTPPETGPRGEAMSMDQWEVLRGGIRHPRRGLDEIRRPRIPAQRARIGVLLRGRLHALPVADDAGRPLPASALAEALRGLVSAPSSWAPAELPFGALSWLPGDRAAELLEAVLAVEHNRRVYEQLTELVFVVSLVEQELDELEHLRRVSFACPQIWVRKPVTYEVGLADSWTGMHLEHSTVDGGTLLAVLRQMHPPEQTDPADAPDQSDPPDDRGTDSTTGSVPVPEPLAWQLSPELRQTVRGELEEVLDAAGSCAVEVVRVPRLDPRHHPFRISDDAALQLILTIAQLRAHGVVRGVYESVDMREFRAGRTECLRPVTAEAVELAAAVRDGTAGLEQVEAAVLAHKAWIKACKAGEGMDRHLMGLRLMVGPDEPVPALLEGPALAAVTEDVLSTTSVGGAERIVRYAFAPSAPDGLGIAYTRAERHYEVCATRHADRADDRLLRALPGAAEDWWDAVAQHSSDSPAVGTA